MKMCKETGTKGLSIATIALLAGATTAFAGTNPCVHNWDDGLSTNSLGFNAAANIVWGNRYFSNVGCDEISSVQVAYGTIPAATPVQVYVLSDPNQDGIPDDSVVLSTAVGVTANENTETFNTYAVPPVTVSGSFFVAVRLAQPAAQFPMRYDGTNPRGQAWLGSGSANANNPYGSLPAGNLLNMIDINFPGDFMVRAGGTGNACATTLKPCATDLNNDNTVNTSDLLTTINNWGQNGNPAGPRPAADSRPLPNGDCIVNTSDLLGIINSWGPCPTPPAPANDLCANATPIGNGIVAWNNAGANTDGPPGGACEANMSRDFWYSYTTTCLGTLRINTEGSFPTTDTIISVYSGNGCPPGALIACDDDGGSGFLSSVAMEVSSGQVLKIRVSSFSGGPVGGGRLVVSCTPHINDTCADPQPVAIGGSINDDIGGAGNENNLPDCNGLSLGIGRWYKVKGNGTTLTVGTCSSSPPGVEVWDPAISVFCSNLSDACANLACAAQANNNTCGPNSLHESVSFCSTNNQDYLILVSSGDPNNNPPPNGGHITLTVSSNGLSCAAPPTQCGAAPPPNDECAGAIALVNGANPLFDNTLATDSQGIPGACPQGGPIDFQRDVWFTYTPAANGTVEFTLCATDLVSGDTVMSVLSGTCGNLTEIACDDDFCGGASFSRVVATGLQAGVPVFVRVGGWQGTIVDTMRVTVNPFTGVCGNGILELGEQCDDGNNIPNDGCTNCLNDLCVYGANCTSEAEPCLVDGATDGNLNGLSDNNPPCGLELGNTAGVQLGQFYCGTCSTYVVGGATNVRDSDHWLFIPPADGIYTLTICADFVGRGNFACPDTAGNANSQIETSCTAGHTVVFYVATATLFDGTPVVMTPVTVPMLAGHHYGIRIRPDATTGLPCGGIGHYKFKVTGP